MISPVSVVKSSALPLVFTIVAIFFFVTKADSFSMKSQRGKNEGGKKGEGEVREQEARTSLLHTQK